MKQRLILSLSRKSMRKHKYLTDDQGNKIFVKEYNTEDIKNPEVLEMEYQKGLAINKIIPYPKPLKIEGNRIYYEHIDIKYSLWEKMVFSKDEVEEDEMKTVGKYLRKMHDNDILHGDFGPSNVVFDKQGKIYFIDASFSKHNTGGKVLWRVQDIYHDISLFLMHLDISKPLWKPYLFLKIKEKKILKKAFLEGYFKNLKNFDLLKNCKKEIEFLNLHCQYLKNKKWKFYTYPMLFLANLFVFLKKSSLKKIKK